MHDARQGHSARLSQSRSNAMRNLNARFTFPHHHLLILCFLESVYLTTLLLRTFQYSAASAPADALSLAGECDAARQA